MGSLDVTSQSWQRVIQKFREQKCDAESLSQCWKGAYNQIMQSSDFGILYMIETIRIW